MLLYNHKNLINFDVVLEFSRLMECSYIAIVLITIVRGCVSTVSRNSEIS